MMEYVNDLYNRREYSGLHLCEQEWPLPGVWLGVSVEDQESANERIPLLLQTPAVVRWVSAEPLLAPVHFSRHWLPSEKPLFSERNGYDPRLDWIVAGSESGPKARPADLEWFRSIKDQCKAAGVPFFMKQITTERGRKIPFEAFPVDLQVREYPEVKS
jgi:protein gp37